jgi:LacI family transcriptional regulator
MNGWQTRPTQADIARETGLSSAAVSYALRGIRLPEETQQRVREVAERLGYETNPIARALACGRTGTVGVLCASLQDVWQQGLAAALGRAFVADGRKVMIVDAGSDPDAETELSKRLVDDRVDALVVLPVDPAADHWTALAERTPLVSIGDALPTASPAAEVVFDNTAGVTRAIDVLVDAGHTHICALTGGGPSTPDRPAEVLLRRLGTERGVQICLVTAPHDLAGASAAAAAVLGRADRPSAMFCLADAFAYGVYAAAADLKLPIPQDISVLGYDDHPFSRLLSPGLTTFRWPEAQLVAEVVEHTARAIDEGRRTKRTVLSPELVTRGSVAHLGGR